MGPGLPLGYTSVAGRRRGLCLAFAVLQGALGDSSLLNRGPPAFVLRSVTTTGVGYVSGGPGLSFDEVLIIRYLCMYRVPRRFALPMRFERATADRMKMLFISG